MTLGDGTTADLDGAVDGACETTIRVCLGESGRCAPAPIARLQVTGGRRGDAALRVRDALETLAGSRRGGNGVTRFDADTASADGCAEARVRVPAGRPSLLRLRTAGATRARARLVLRCVDGVAARPSCDARDGTCPPLADAGCAGGACAVAAPGNLAPLAVALASREESALSSAARAIDGTVPPPPGDPRYEWIAGPGAEAPFLRLTWPTPVLADRVVLHDRAAPGANVRAATLLADDVEVAAVGPLPADGTPLAVAIGPRTLQTLTVVLTDGDGPAGLAEVVVLPPDANTDSGEGAPPVGGTPPADGTAPPDGATPVDGEAPVDDPPPVVDPDAGGPATPAPVIDVAASASGTRWYLSPRGNDGNAGTSADRPFRTFRKALEGRRLKPGDTLILLDGEYTKGTTGLPLFDCRSDVGNARNGAAGAPITIAAQNERRAHLLADGSSEAFQLHACSYWRVQGLRGTNRDGTAAKPWDGNVFQITSSSNVELRRLLAVHPNRNCSGSAAGKCNSHGIAIEQSHHVLLEESEVYDYHRHGISVFADRWVTLRRCYVHSRKSNRPTAIIFYGSSDSIAENCVVEQVGGINIAGTKAFDGSPGGYRNKLLGVVSLDGSYGSTIRARRFSGRVLPVGDNLVKDSVFARMANVGVYSRGAAETVLDHVTLYASKIDSGLAADEDRGEGAPCSANPAGCSVTSRSTLSFANAGRGARVDTAVTRRWTIERARFAQNGEANFPTREAPSDGSGNIRWSNATAPTKMGLGSGQCLVWVPDGSNGKGAGEAGTDVGANILRRYENGVLTTVPLWDRSSGAFPCGAVVAGVNDQAGRSCFDVHRRLNVNTNGCSFPAGYR